MIEDMLPVASHDMLSERFLLGWNSEKIKQGKYCSSILASKVVFSICPSYSYFLNIVKMPDDIGSLYSKVQIDDLVCLI